MKQTITSLALLSLLAAAPLASADELRDRPGMNEGPRPMKVEMRERELVRATSTEMERERDGMDSEMRSSTSPTRASTTARKLELKMNIVKRQAEHAGEKLLATIERLDKIAARLESRITKVESAGGVATTSRAFLLEAKDSLAKARMALQVFSQNTLSSTNLAQSLEQIRTSAETVKTHLKDAQRALVDATLSLKPGRAVKDGMGRASTTASSTSATTTSH